MIDRKERYKQELQRVRRYGPSDGDNLLGMEEDFVAYLSGLDQLDASTITVRRTGNLAELIVAEAAAAKGVPLDAATQAVVQAWLGELGYTYSEAHYVETLPDRAILRFVTQIGPGGFYVTGRITVAAGSGRDRA